MGAGVDTGESHVVVRGAGAKEWSCTSTDSDVVRVNSTGESVESSDLYGAGPMPYGGGAIPTDRVMGCRPCGVCSGLVHLSDVSGTWSLDGGSTSYSMPNNCSAVVANDCPASARSFGIKWWRKANSFASTSCCDGSIRYSSTFVMPIGTSTD